MSLKHLTKITFFDKTVIKSQRQKQFMIMTRRILQKTATLRITQIQCGMIMLIINMIYMNKNLWKLEKLKVGQLQDGNVYLFE